MVLASLSVASGLVLDTVTRDGARSSCSPICRARAGRRRRHGRKPEESGSARTPRPTIGVDLGDRALLAGADIDCMVLDGNMSVLDGSSAFWPRGSWSKTEARGRPQDACRRPVSA